MRSRAIFFPTLTIYACGSNSKLLGVRNSGAVVALVDTWRLEAAAMLTQLFFWYGDIGVLNGSQGSTFWEWGSIAFSTLSTGSVRLTRNLTPAITTRFTSAVLFSPCYTQAFSFTPSPGARCLWYRGDAGLQMQESAGEPIRMSPPGTMKIRQRRLSCCLEQQPRRYQFTRRRSC